LPDRGESPLTVAGLLDVLASLACIVGGGLLVTFTSADPGSYSFSGHNFFETASHGVGLYCIGKGLFIARSAYLVDQARSALGRLVEFAAHRHSREGPQPWPGEDTPTSYERR